MDKLPPEMLLRVAKHVSWKDVPKLKGVSKRFRKMVESNKKVFQKPQISIKLDQNKIYYGHSVIPMPQVYYDNYKYTMTVDTPKGEVEFAISPLKATIKPTNADEPATSLVTSYFNAGGGFYRESQSIDIHHFLAWLLSKADVNTLDIQKYNGETCQFSWVVNAIVDSKARCHNLVMDSMFGYVGMANSKNGNFIKKLAESQKANKNPSNLQIMYNFVLFPFLDGFSKFTKYSDDFSSITVELSYNDVVQLIYRTVQQWVEGELKEQRFNLRLTDMETGNCTRSASINEFVNRLLALKVTLVNTTRQELLKLPKVVRAFPPAFIDIGNNSDDGKVLRFKFDRVENATVVTLDFSPC